MFSKIIKHPATQLVIGIIVTAAFFYFVERKEVQPRYAVGEPETLAEATADAPRLKLLWEDEEIENIHTIDVVIWNAGRQYLDKNSISATDPIRITYPPGVQILYMKFARTSRDNLEFTATDLADAGTSAIQIEIVGDEALERKDGGLLKILFSGRSTNRFAVTGRIKGSREGFTKVDWDQISESGPAWVGFVLVAIAAIFTKWFVPFPMRILGRFRIFAPIREKTEPEFMFLLIMFLTALLVVSLLRSNVVRLLFGLPWLP